MTELFKGARLKIERADHHIRNLERQLSEFTREYLDASVRQRDDGKLDIVFTAMPPPSCIALVIGDAVHNLWSAMDHLYWEAVGLGGGCQHDQLYCPKGRDRASYKGTCYGVKTLTGEVEQIFESLEAFPDGVGHFLYVVRCLDNTDKHSVLTPVVSSPDVGELVVVTASGKIRGPLANLYGGNAVLHHGETFTIDGAPAGTRLAFKNNEQISPHILFGDVEFVQHKPVYPTILQLRHAVANAVEIVARAIS